VPVSSLFCRHNRFTADCPICSKGTVLDAGRAAERRPRPKPSGGSRRRSTDAPAKQFSGPHVTAGPYEREDGAGYEVRLERVPGGVRLAQWSGGHIERRAPELPAGALVELVTVAAARELLPAADAQALLAALTAGDEGGGGAGSSAAGSTGDGAAGAGASAGRAGDLREELRVEPLDGDRLRIGRWLLYPSRGWELQDAPPMLPAARYAEALRGAAQLGLLKLATP
jgi:hypothetical protein